MSLSLPWALAAGVPVGLLLDALITRLPALLFPGLRAAPGFRKSTARRTGQTTIVIALAMAIVGWTAGRPGSAGQVVFLTGWLCALVVLSGIDLRYYLLPDVLTLGLLALALAGSHAGVCHTGVWAGLCGAAFGYGLLWCLNAGYRRMRGQDGFGGGDLKMTAALGAGTGVTGVIDILTLASLLALAVVGARSWFSDARISLRSRVPFGPFLASAAALILIWQTETGGQSLFIAPAAREGDASQGDLRPQFDDPVGRNPEVRRRTA